MVYLCVNNCIFLGLITNFVSALLGLHEFDHSIIFVREFYLTILIEKILVYLLMLT